VKPLKMLWSSNNFYATQTRYYQNKYIISMCRHIISNPYYRVSWNSLSGKMFASAFNVNWRRMVVCSLPFFCLPCHPCHTSCRHKLQISFMYKFEIFFICYLEISNFCPSFMLKYLVTNMIKLIKHSLLCNCNFPICNLNCMTLSNI